MDPTPPLSSRIVAAGAGATWWADGWRMFRSRIGAWAAIVVVYFVISMVLNSVPRLGAIADWLLSSVLVGGIMLGCNAAQRGEPLRLSHLFDGFRAPQFVPLLRIALWNLALAGIGVGIAVIVVVASAGVAGLDEIANHADDPVRMWEVLGFACLLLLMLALVFTAMFAMANWFAAALVVLNGATALAAMKASFSACLRNWLPFLVYGAIGIGILLGGAVLFVVLAGLVGFETFVALFSGAGGVGAFTLGVGLIIVVYAALAAVLAAITFDSTYAGYRDIFAADEPAAPAPA